MEAGMNMEDEIKLICQLLSHPAGFDIDCSGSLAIRPIGEALPIKEWEVSWDGQYGSSSGFTKYESFAVLDDAVRFFVLKRHETENGLDFECRMGRFPFSELYARSYAHQRDRALDMIFEYFDEADRRHQYDLCDITLDLVDMDKLDSYVVIGFLSASFPFQNKLFKRELFLERTRKWLASVHKTQSEIDAMLKGLE